MSSNFLIISPTFCEIAKMSKYETSSSSPNVGINRLKNKQEPVGFLEWVGPHPCSCPYSCSFPYPCPCPWTPRLGGSFPPSSFILWRVQVTSQAKIFNLPFLPNPAWLWDPPLQAQRQCFLRRVLWCILFSFPFSIPRYPPTVSVPQQRIRKGLRAVVT